MLTCTSTWRAYELFIGFSADRERLDKMLEQMAEVGDGVRDALARYTTPLSDAQYFVPSLQAMRRFTSTDRGLSPRQRKSRAWQYCQRNVV